MATGDNVVQIIVIAVCVGGFVLVMIAAGFVDVIRERGRARMREEQRRRDDLQASIEAASVVESTKPGWRECPGPNCDRMNRPKAKFCGSCGCDLSKVNAAAQFPGSGAKSAGDF